MEGFLLYVFLMSILLLIVAKLVSGIEVESYGHAVLAAFGLGVLNALVRPLLVILTFPITILTLGLFLLVINALLLKLCSAVVPGFHVKSFTAALLASFVLAVLSFGVSLIA